MISTIAAIAIAAALPAHLDLNSTSINAQTLRTETVFYSTAAQALVGRYEESPWYLDLNGTWDFAYFEAPSEPADAQLNPVLTLPEGIKWSSIKVPGNWERQGFGTAIYRNTAYEFSAPRPTPPQLPAAIPLGVYRRSFSVPANWQGRDVFLNLCGAKSGVYVYVNGAFVGYSEDSKDLARFPLGGFLKEGENELVLKIYRWSTGSYMECQDFWRISGIERDVYLSSESGARNGEEAQRGFDFSVVSTLDANLRDGIFRLESTSPVSYRLLDRARNVVAEDSRGVSHPAVRIPNVLKWSAEEPNLYTLLIEKEGEFTAFDVGFRRFEIKGDIFLVNGQPVKFKGVNLHEHNQFTGHYTDRAYIRRNLQVMRSLNVNAIRTCHYPQSRAFYELCDSLGFYVYCEANLESHGMGYGPESLAKHPEWEAKHIDRVQNMYYRTRNYPCVTLLSLGNESGNGVNFVKCYKLLKDMEVAGQNRPVVYEQECGGPTSDFINPMYPNAQWFRDQGENPPGKPCVPCEYSHAMGNSNGSIDLQWQAIYKYLNLQGAFIWDWVDQGFAEKDSRGRTYWTYGGDYGPDNFISDYDFLINGVVGPDLVPHPAAAEIKYWHQNVWVTRDPSLPAATGNLARYRIENRFYFRSLAGLSLLWEVHSAGRVAASGRKALSAPAQGEEFIDIELPADEDGPLYVNFSVVTTARQPLLPAGFEVASAQDLIATGGKTPDFAKARVKGRSVKLAKRFGKRVIIAKTADAKMVFDPATGVLLKYKVRGKNLISRRFGLKPNFWRAPVDNDWGDGMPWRAGAWKLDSLHVASVDAVCVGEGALVTAVYDLPYGCRLTVEYLLQNDGRLHIGAAFRGNPASHCDIPRIGFRTRLGKGADSFRYLGRGPEENYFDRKTGTFFGEYEGSASASLAPYVRPQETGHHTDCRWLRAGKLLVVADSLFEFNALRVSIEDLDPRPDVSDVVIPERGSGGVDAFWLGADKDFLAPMRAEFAKRGAMFRTKEGWKDVLLGNKPIDSLKVEKAAHINDVSPRRFVELCIDCGMTGIGGYNSWRQRPEPSRTLWSDHDYAFGFTLGLAR